MLPGPAASPVRWRVLVPLPVPAYDYRPPHGWRGEALGRRVLVPWHGGARVGVVAGVAPDGGADGGADGGELREAIAVLDTGPLLGPDGLASLLAVARRTMAPEGLVLCDLVPFGLEPAYGHRARLVPGVEVAGLPRGTAALLDWADAAGLDPGLLEFLRGQGLLEERAWLERPTREVIRPAPGDGPPLTPKQRLALEVLREAGAFERASSWARAAGVSTSVVTALVRHGLARVEREPTPPPNLQGPPPGGVRPGGQDGLELGEGDGRLHGGKPRERYALLAGLIRHAPGTALYLAPDRTTLERAWAALGALRPSCLIHMGLTPREREEVWRRAASGQAELVFGTAMALLAPLPGLALIVVDEEGSDAYKLAAGSRLFVPDAARLRATEAGARLVLTGAAPAVESLLVPGLVLAPPRARLHVVDFSVTPVAPEMGPLSGHPPAREGWPLSSQLKKLLRQVAERSRQAVLIAPRRGYSAVVKCADCGWLPFCPNCDVPLRLHAERRRLECHQCGHASDGPRRCPKCEGHVFSPRGPGSEWIAAELRRFLPNTPVYRYDRDRKDDLSEFERPDSPGPGVVVGTTAVLGRPAPPNLALVALTFADTFVAHPDFRAAERYHSLLRRLLEWHPSRAPLLVVQTFAGGHPVLESVLDGSDAASYPESELELRRGFGYPPYTELAQVQVAARRPGDAERAAEALSRLILDRGASRDELLGPVPAPIAKIKGLYAYHMLVRAPTDDRLSHLLEPARRFREGSRVRVDVNPRNFTGLIE